MYQAFNRSNFQQEIHELFYDLVVFGTAALFVDMDEQGLRFNARHIAEICISENAQGEVDTAHRKFEMTARAMAQRFGEQNLPDIAKKDFEKDPYKKHNIVHAVYPRGERAVLGGRKPLHRCIIMPTPYKS